MQELVGLVGATAVLYAFVAFFFLVVWRVRAARRDYLVLAAFFGSLSEQAFARLGMVRSTHPEFDEVFVRAAWAGLVASFAFVLHYAFIQAGVAERRRTVRTTYGIALACELLNAVAFVFALRAASFDASTSTTLQRDVDAVLYTVTTLGTMTGIAIAVVLGRQGKVRLVPLFVSAVFLLATVASTFRPAPPTLFGGAMVEVGSMAFALGLTFVMAVTYAETSNVIARQTEEVSRRTSELEASSHALRTTQAELHKKEQLAAVGELAAVVAHEVRNPLAIIANAGAGLRRQDLSGDDRETLLTILDEETQRLNRLVSDLLHYARPLAVQRTQIVLADLVERALSLGRARPGITVDAVHGARVSRMWGDGNLLRQVFENLVDNAVQAMPEGGSLRTTVSVVTRNGIDGFEVAFEDTGEGMDTAVSSRAKDPFFTTRPSGTGLGLAIVDRIVAAHGGTFRIVSRAGVGTQVTVFLPAISPSETPRDTPDTRSGDGDRGTGVSP
ncbi:MAG: ATP-binding protein [Polyangiaceae bacterium]